MRIRIRSKLWGNLTDYDKERLLPLTVPGVSGFRRLLRGTIILNNDAIVSIAIDTDTGKWVGWSTTEPLQKGKTVEVGVYVKSEYRRCGIGKRLISHGIKRSGRSSVRCFMWNREAQEFYRNSFGARLTNEEARGWAYASRFTVGVS